MTDASKTGGLEGMWIVAPGPFLLAALGLALFLSLVGGPRELQHFDADTYPAAMGLLCTLPLAIAFVTARQRAVPGAVFAGLSLLPWWTALFLSLQDMREMDQMVSSFIHTQQGKNIIGTGLGEQLGVMALGLWLSGCLLLACALGWAWAARKADEHRARAVPRVLLISSFCHFALAQLMLGRSWTFMSSGTLYPEAAQRWAALGAAKATPWERGVQVALLLLVVELLFQVYRSVKRPSFQRELASLLVLAVLVAGSIGLGFVSLREGVRVATRYDVPLIP